MEVYKSNIDRSVNFVERTSDDGAFESRYVRRTDDYFIAYLSSHTGCNKACRFCHLTATGQTMMRDATIHDYMEQARLVLYHYRTENSPANRVNYNFMARGEPLSNRHLTSQWHNLEQQLSGLAAFWGVKETKFNISTIMPKEMIDIDLIDVFGRSELVMPYYSLYSLKERFRKRWLPKAIEPRLALRKLADWQQASGQDVALHWAFIEGENDDEETLEEIVNAVREVDLRAKFNLVRYNPYSDRQGKEPSEEIIERNFQFMADALGHPGSRIVPRVGKDVNASCGMFIE